MDQFEQCLLCKAVKSDPNSVYTSDGEMVCEECQEWLRHSREEIDSDFPEI